MDTKDKKCILIVEDHPIQAKIAKSMFSKLGYEVEHTMNGNEAVELVKKNYYMVVCMDIGLNGISGDDACKLIREYEQQHDLEQTPIIAVTANTNPEELTLYKESGMQEALSKPLTMEKIKYILSFSRK
jgi:CheY-like chemotaxis protein